LKSTTTDSDDLFSTKLMRRMFDNNVFGLMDVTTAALPYLRKSKDGRMVVVGSRSAWKAEIPVSKILNSRLMYFKKCLPNCRQ
jgi:NADP-dependent 3-hydroxy acid dehydrogenase YdfG